MRSRSLSCASRRPRPQDAVFDAEDTMRLIESFAGCAAKVKQEAAAMRSEIHSLSETEHRR